MKKRNSPSTDTKAKPGSEPVALQPGAGGQSRISLRHEAEARLRAREAKSSKKIGDQSPEDLQTIVHELQVHQIQLELQNEEMRRVQAELDLSRTRYFELFDLAPVGYITVSESGLILEANLTFATQLGVPRGELVGAPLHRFIHRQEQDAFYLMHNRVLETGAPHACELRMLKSDGTVFWGRMEAAATPTEDTMPVLRISISDINARKQTEEELRRSEQNFRTVADFTYGWEYWSGTDGRILYISPSCERISGYTREEFLSDNQLLQRIVHPEDAEKFTAHLEEAHRPGTGMHAGGRVEFRIIKKDASVVWIDHVCRPVFTSEGANTGIRVSNRDITARKQADTLLQENRMTRAFCFEFISAS